jgi:hypothetical protein
MGFSDGIHQQGIAEEELIADVSEGKIGGIDKGQSSHRDFAAVGGAPCCRVDIGEESIAQVVVLCKDLLNLRTVLPKFSLGVESVNAEDGTKGAVLKPADEQFTIVRRGVLVVWTEEAADIRRPVWNAGHA